MTGTKYDPLGLTRTQETALFAALARALAGGWEAGTTEREAAARSLALRLRQPRFQLWHATTAELRALLVAASSPVGKRNMRLSEVRALERATARLRDHLAELETEQAEQALWRRRWYG
jgi:hypothetical protein